MFARIIAITIFFLLSILATGQETELVYLSGKDADDAVAWDFYCTSGTRAGEWTTIPVPSNWELQGFGTYNYGLDGRKAREQGKYRTRFSVPAQWREKTVKIVFAGAMTDTRVRINGEYIGPPHQGGFYQFEYDITRFLKWGAENQLDVIVNKVSDNDQVERAERQADYWVFGGIYRPVYLKALPAEHIAWTAIDARADGAFKITAYTSALAECDELRAQLLDERGNQFGGAFSAAPDKNQTRFLLETTVAGQHNWSAETPRLYSVQLELLAGSRVVHRVTERFGFRTFEVRAGDGLYLNGEKIRLKGVNRHSFWPDSGRCLSAKISYNDAALIKSMNMNAARMSHYPPEQEFLDACDELGLYVLDELAGWHRPPYDTTTGKKLLAEMLIRDVNHPCILFWDNGNEGGWNEDLDAEFHKFDPQRRPVLHPWRTFSGIDTSHYEDYDEVVEKLKGPTLYMPTEFLHGLYDGGHGASLEDYWNAMRASPFGAGGFLWVLADEGVVRADQNGRLDTDGNHGPDGIVGPYREKEGSYYTIKELWSPVRISLERLPENFKGAIPLENQYDFSNLNRVQFAWQWIGFAAPDSAADGHRVIFEGTQAGPDVPPGAAGVLALELPAGWRDCDALRLTATDWSGMEVWSWCWTLQFRARLPALQPPPKATDRLQTTIDARTIRVNGADFEFRFDNQTGLLAAALNGEREYVLQHGPRLTHAPPQIQPPPRGQAPAAQPEIQPASVPASEPRVTVRQRRKRCEIRARDSGGLDRFVWTVYADGRLHLAYQYRLAGEYDFFGVAFDCAEQNMHGLRWLGQGPFRVWQNRRRGGRLDVWRREYNRGIAGENWLLPEFGGYYADVYWCELQTPAGRVRIYSPIEPGTGAAPIFLRVGEIRGGADPLLTNPPNPAGELSFMHAISAIGSKGRVPGRQGPQGRPARAAGKYSGELIFEFD